MRLINFYSAYHITFKVVERTLMDQSLIFLQGFALLPPVYLPDFPSTLLYIVQTNAINNNHVINFTINKHFGLVNMNQSGLEQNDTKERGREDLSAISNTLRICICRFSSVN